MSVVSVDYESEGWSGRSHWGGITVLGKAEFCMGSLPVERQDTDSPREHHLSLQNQWRVTDLGILFGQMFIHFQTFISSSLNRKEENMNSAFRVADSSPPARRASETFFSPEHQAARRHQAL